MSIQDKIEEIRQKPEHIRIRYAWMYTALAMLLVILIWIMSFGATKESKTEDPTFIPPETIEQIQENKESLKDTTEQMKGTLENARQQIPQNPEGFQ